MIGIVIIVIAIGIGAAIGISQAKKNQQLIDEGKMIRRQYRYAEQGEEFTAKIGSYKALADQIKNMYRPCSAEGNASSQVNFTGQTFAARLYRVAFDTTSGVGVYRFEFTRWKEYRGQYEGANAMNILLTSIEKCFLALDPNTGVTSYPINFKTKHKLF